MEDSTKIQKKLEMHINGRNEGLTVVVVDESSKSSLIGDIEECEKQVQENFVANKNAIKIPTKKDGVMRFGKDGRYPKNKRRPPGE